MGPENAIVHSVSTPTAPFPSARAACYARLRENPGKGSTAAQWCTVRSLWQRGFHFIKLAAGTADKACPNPPTDWVGFGNAPPCWSSLCLCHCGKAFGFPKSSRVFYLSSQTPDRRSGHPSLFAKKPSGYGTRRITNFPFTSAISESD